MWPFLLIPLAIALSMTLTRFERSRLRRRISTLETALTDRGLETSEERDTALRIRFLSGDLPFCNQAPSGYWPGGILNRRLGTWRVALFDFSNGGGPDRGDDETTVFWAHCREVDLSRFLSLPRATRLGIPLPWYAWDYNLPASYTVDHFAGLPVRLDAWPILTRRRFLCAENPEIISDRLGEALVRLCRSHPDLCIEAGGSDLVVYHRKRRLSAKQTRRLYHSGSSLLRQVDAELPALRREAVGRSEQPLRHDPAFSSTSPTTGRPSR